MQLLLINKWRVKEMEQYEISTETIASTMKILLKYWKPKCLHVRFVGSSGGKRVIDENLENKDFEIKEIKKDFVIFIEKEKRFNFSDHRNWTIAYDRNSDGETYFIAVGGFPNLIDPYKGPDDPRLPEVKFSTLRGIVNSNQLFELTFYGKVLLHKYWSIDISR